MRYFSPSLSIYAPPFPSLPNDARADSVSMTNESAEEIGSKVVNEYVPCIDVGVQTSPIKKNARVQTRHRCFSVGECTEKIQIASAYYSPFLQLSADAETKDAAVQCSLPYTYTVPITKDASV